jgi:hypothetical protein
VLLSDRSLKLNSLNWFRSIIFTAILPILSFFLDFVEKEIFFL